MYIQYICKMPATHTQATGDDDPYQVLDPLVGLPLGVNEEGPPPGVLHNGPILHRQSVLGEASNLPPTYLDRIPKRREQGSRGGVGDIEMGQLLLPNANELSTILALQREKRGRVMKKKTRSGENNTYVMDN